jgi:hypothetical protein
LFRGISLFVTAPDSTVAKTARLLGFRETAKWPQTRKVAESINQVDSRKEVLERYIQVFLDALIFRFRFVTSLAIRGLARAPTVFCYRSSACSVAVPAKQDDVLSNYLSDVPFHSVLVVVGTVLQPAFDI